MAMRMGAEVKSKLGQTKLRHLILSLGLAACSSGEQNLTSAPEPTEAPVVQEIYIGYHADRDRPVSPPIKIDPAVTKLPGD